MYEGCRGASTLAREAPPAGGPPARPPTLRLRRRAASATISPMKRSRALKPLSSEHHQALLVAFQLKKGLAGHAESAGAPKDLPGLLALARRFDEKLFRAHARAEEELLGRYLTSADMRRLRGEHAELGRHLEDAKRASDGDLRASLSAYAELLERHVRWEERELFAFAEANVDSDALATIGGELERRLAMPRSDRKAAAS